MIEEYKKNLIIDMEAIVDKLNNGYPIDLCCVVDQIYYIMSLEDSTTSSSGTSNTNNATLSFSTLQSTPGGYTLPIASPSILGGVKIGNNISIASDGTISVVVNDYWTIGLPNDGDSSDIFFRDKLVIATGDGLSAGIANQTLTLSLVLGETSVLPYRGDRGKTAYDHTFLTNNPHAVTKTQVSLGNVDNTADVDKNVLSATKLTTARNIAISGGVTGTVSFDGSGDVTIVSTLRTLTSSDIPNLSWTKITSGKPTTLSGYGITDAMATSHVANTITSTNITEWNTAFGWGNHALVGYLTSITKPMVEAVLTGAITSHTHPYEPIITAGTTSQYWRGDKTWQTLDKAAVGLSNVPNLSFSGSNTGDNAVNSLYSGLITNATHTGDATGSSALTVVGINGTLIANLATGLLKNTTGTGIPSIATPGSDYLLPNGDGSALTNITYTQVGADAAGTAAGLMSTHNSTYNHANIANGQTAYTWGNHAGLYLPLVGGNVTGPVTITTSSLATGLDSISQGVGIVGTGTGVNGYGLVGYASNIPIQAASLDTTPTGVKTCLVLTNDSANTSGVAPTFGLSIDWAMPWLGNPLFTSRAGRMVCEWTDTTYTSEAAKFNWILRSGGAEFTRMSLSHLGALTTNSNRIIPAASAPTSPVGGEIYTNVNGHLYYHNSVSWIQLDGGVSSIGVEWIDFTFNDIAVAPGQVYTLDLKASVAYNILGLVLISDTGTITLTCKINTTAVTGLTAVTATNSIQDYTATTLNAVAVGQKVTLTITNLASTPTVLTGKLKYLRV